MAHSEAWRRFMRSLALAVFAATAAMMGDDLLPGLVPDAAKWVFFFAALLPVTYFFFQDAPIYQNLRDERKRFTERALGLCTISLLLLGAVVWFVAPAPYERLADRVRTWLEAKISAPIASEENRNRRLVVHRYADDVERVEVTITGNDLVTIRVTRNFEQYANWLAPFPATDKAKLTLDLAAIAAQQGHYDGTLLRVSGGLFVMPLVTILDPEELSRADFHNAMRGFDFTWQLIQREMDIQMAEMAAPQ